MSELCFSASQLFSQHDRAITMSIVIVGALLVVSLGVVIHVLLISREREFSFRTAMSSALTVLWTVPVFAILAVFVYQARGHFQEPNPSPISIEGSSSSRAEPEFEAVDPAPDWTNDTKLLVISARGATVAEAERKLAERTRHELAKIAETASKNSQRLYRIASQADQNTIRTHAVKRRVEQRGVEKIHVARPGKSEKEYSNQIVQVYWNLHLSLAMCEKIQQQATLPRVWLVGGFFGLLALIAFGASTYFRLDARTFGKFRTRLKLATTSLIVAGGLLIIAFLPSI